MTLPTRRLGVASIALALLIAGCDAETEQPAAPKADHTTASARASEPGPADPASGVLTRSWSADLRGRFTGQNTRFAFAAGQLLVTSPRGIDAYATADGKARWHYYEPGRQVAGHAVTAGTIVLVTRRPDQSDVRTVGLDAATGRVLWRSAAYRPVYGPVFAGGRGIVALADAKNPSALAGVDVRTGTRRWNWPGPGPAMTKEQPCRNVPHDSDGAILLIETECVTGETLYALDPGTGRPVWQRAHEVSRDWAVSRAGVTLTRGGFGTLHLIGRDGRDLHEFDVLTAVEPDSLAVTGGRAVVAHWTPEGPDAERRMASVDLRSGKVTERVESNVSGELAVVSGQVYGQLDHLGDRDRRGEPGLLAGGLEIIDPRTLRGRLRPLPSAAASGFWDAADSREPLGPVLLDGGRVYTAVPVNGGLRLTAYVPGEDVRSPELGGVRPDDWPDACTLGQDIVGKDSAGTDMGGELRAEAPLKAGPLRVPDWSCVITLDSGVEYRVKVAWVARDAAEADRMLDPAGSDAEPLTGLGDEAYEFQTWPSEEIIALRVGRYVVTIASRADGGPRILGKYVARRLERLDE